MLRKIFAMGALLVLAGCGGGGGGDSPSGNTRPSRVAAPVTVSFTAPANRETGVPTNTLIIAVFSEDKDPATVKSATFSLDGVEGTVSYDAATRTAQLTPTTELLPNTVYTATITKEVKNLAGQPMPADYQWSFTTGAEEDLKNPTVVSIDTAHGSAGSATNTDVSVTFSEVMTPATINDQTVVVTDGDGQAVDGTVTYNGKTATFTPSEDLQPDSDYTVTVTPGAEDLSQNPVGGDASGTFTTGDDIDTSGPTVVASIPAPDAVDVFINRAVAIDFSESVSPSSVTTQTITLQEGSGFIPGSVASIGSIVIFTPSADLPPNTAFTVTITSGVRDLAGNPAPGTDIWTFTTGASRDTAPPAVLGTIPANGEVDVSVDSALSIRFGEGMNPFVFGAVDGIPGVVSYDFLTASFSLTPSMSLKSNTTYTGTMTGRDLAGNVTTYSWRYMTAP